MKSEIKLALKVTSPVLFGYIALGIAFGLMVAEKGYPFWMTPLMSIFMFTGAGQYVAIGLFAAGTPLAAIIITEAFVSIRHIVYGLSLISYMLCLLSRKKSRKDHSAIYQLLYSWIMNMFIP